MLNKTRSIESSSRPAVQHAIVAVDDPNIRQISASPENDLNVEEDSIDMDSIGPNL